MEKKKLKEIIAHPVWFLIGSLLFAAGGVILFLRGDSTGGLIYVIVGGCFLIGFLGQIIFNRKRR